ncbi:MAG: metallophosphoesterase [Deltaproteobacteria bacterium]|nr:metallophosphoesterase [Candidatus Zymogenaceae bacterium]
MKILHTADLHLKALGDERWEALTAVVEIGRKHKIDALVIAGDLFDRGIDAERLRTAVRPIFSGTGFPVLILPGNHDRESFRPGDFFGENTVILGDAPFILGDVSFCALPFEPGDRQRVLARLHGLRGRLDPACVNILIYHGELIDTFFSRADFGDEGADRYMPARLSWFADLGLSYVLAGHFHSKFTIRTFGDGGFFVYPGSPVSVTKKEAGRRGVNLFETGMAPAELFLDTPHYADEEIVCNPFSNRHPLEIIKERLSGLHPQATALISVKGFIDGARLGTDESSLLEEIKKIARGRAEVDEYSVRDVSTILADGLFSAFSERLAAEEPDEERRARVTRMVIEAMMEAAR